MPARPEHASRFRELHREGAGLVMPNAWDVGTAIVLAETGFEAIATTSAGIAFSLGRADHVVPAGATAVSRAEMFERMRAVAGAVEVPVNGDLQDGFGATPDEVAETVRLAIEAGLAGGNIEDQANGVLYEEQLAVERIEAARAAIDAAGSDFVLTARTDGQHVEPRASLSSSIARANRYREAGADCLYVPGVNDLDDNARLVREIEGPLNVVIGLGSTGLSVPALRRIGVTRISLGGTIARAALGLVREAAVELLGSGTLGFAERQIGQGELNALFAGAERARVERVRRSRAPATVR